MYVFYSDFPVHIIHTHSKCEKKRRVLEFNENCFSVILLTERNQQETEAQTASLADATYATVFALYSGMKTTVFFLEKVLSFFRFISLVFMYN